MCSSFSSTCSMLERERRIGAGTNRNPLVGLAGGVTADRIDDHELHAAGARLGHVERIVIVGAARGDAELGADQHAEVGVVQIGLLMETAAGKEFDRMHHLAAGR